MSQINRLHRTALVIYAVGDHESYQNRVIRLLQSVNGVNIKTDVFLVVNLGEGPEVHCIMPHTTPSETTRLCAFDDFQALLDEAGYDMLLHAHSSWCNFSVEPTTVSAALFHGEWADKAADLAEMFEMAHKLANNSDQLPQDLSALEDIEKEG